MIEINFMSIKGIIFLILHVFIVMQKVSNTCYIRNYGIPYGEYVLVRKGSNPSEPKEYWVPKHY